MPKKYPECPLVNHSNYRELHSPKLCAIDKKDKKGKKEGKINISYGRSIKACLFWLPVSF